MQILCYENNGFRNNSNKDETHAQTAEYGLLLLFRCCPDFPDTLERNVSLPNPATSVQLFVTVVLYFRGRIVVPWRESKGEKRAIGVAGVRQVYTSGYRGY